MRRWFRLVSLYMSLSTGVVKLLALLAFAVTCHDRVGQWRPRRVACERRVNDVQSMLTRVPWRPVRICIEGACANFEFIVNNGKCIS